MKSNKFDFIYAHNGGVLLCIFPHFISMSCYGRPLLHAWLLPDLNTALGRILFGSVVMVLAFHQGVPGSNPARTFYFWHAFVHLYLCYVFVRVILSLGSTSLTL